MWQCGVLWVRYNYLMNGLYGNTWRMGWCEDNNPNLKSGMSGCSSYIDYLLLSMMKRCNMKANTSSWTAIARSHVVFVKVDLCRSDVQIKYGEQNGVQQLLCDNEPQMKSTLESVEGGVIYSAINAVQFWCRLVTTAMWTHRTLSLHQYCTWLSTTLLLAVKQYCFWPSSNTTSGCQTILLLALKQYYFRL
jgi:hypothetical protein